MSRLETRNLATLATNVNINRLQRNIVDLNPRGEAATQAAEVKAALEMAANIHGINGLNEATLPNGHPSVTNSIIANGNCNCKNARLPTITLTEDSLATETGDNRVSLRYIAT